MADRMAPAAIEIDLEVRAAKLAEAVEHRRPGADIEAAAMIEVDRALQRDLLIRKRDAAEAILRGQGDSAGDGEGRRRRGGRLSRQRGGCESENRRGGGEKRAHVLSLRSAGRAPAMS